MNELDPRIPSAQVELGKFLRAKEMQRRVRSFMDGIDWEDHLGEDCTGTELYPSEADLIAGAGHDLSECGIVEVEVRLIRWVKEQKLGCRGHNDREADLAARRKEKP